ncbi:hypothetical protein Poli38472_014112 [Pythium oligandrum]|uniref:Serine aminopeptidase S33 domain-containing protein n=1 Tax=Pythium oligandrum TaxID=41045 RepID=A0A8K1CQD2_PYTOL|nr:hypothetical protein Poli38472_014112 [Pythium oligandrum]|eukprot:TMW66800.1 hypothetical protein Poli38472_014112 [Pythium oligandrum]
MRVLSTSLRVLRRPIASLTRPVRVAAVSFSTDKSVLPESQELDIGGRYTIKYIDLHPTKRDGKHPTIVLFHGGPGSYEDFRHFIPLIQENARVIGINLPGNGGSLIKATDRKSYYNDIQAINIGHAAFQAVTQLCEADEAVFIVGQSLGGHTAINVVALNEKDRPVNVRGLALLAPIGLRIHKALSPTLNSLLWRILQSDIKAIENVSREFVRFMFTSSGFRANQDIEFYVSGFVRNASTDFDLIKTHVQSIHRVPTLCAWAKNDAFVQEEIFCEMSAQLPPGPRFAFERGGHNIQKTRAEFLSQQLVEWMQRVLEDENEAKKETRDIVGHP